MTESDYDFRERVYDATRKAETDTLGRPVVAIVAAYWDDRTIDVVEKADSSAAREWIARNTFPGAKFHIVGEDILGESEE